MGSVCFKAQKEAEEGEREQNKSREEQRQQAQPESGQSQQQQQQQQLQEAEGAVAEKRQEEQPQSDEQRQPSDGAVLTDQGPGKAQPSEQQQAAHGDRAAESNGIPAGPAASQPLMQPQPQAQPQLASATDSSAAPVHNSSDYSNNNNTSGGGTGSGNGSGKAAAGPEFRRMALEELMAATNNFSEKNVVSEGGRQALNVVYRGVLGPEGLPVAVKRFQKKEWENAQQFAGYALGLEWLQVAVKRFQKKEWENAQQFAVSGGLCLADRRLPLCFCAGPVPPRFAGPPHSSVLLLAPTAALASNAPSPVLPLAFRAASASRAVGISRPFFLHARGDFLADATPPPISLPAYAADLANVPRPLPFPRCAAADQASQTRQSVFYLVANAHQASAPRLPASHHGADAEQASAALRSTLLRAADADQASTTLRSALLRAADADQASATLRSALLRAADADQASATLRSALLRAADADQASATLRSALLRAADADQASATLRSALLRAADADQASATLRSALLRAADADQASATLRSALLRAADADQASATLRSALLCAADADQASATLRSALLRAADAEQASATLRSALLRAADADQASATLRSALLRAADADQASATLRSALLRAADADQASATLRSALLCAADADQASATLRSALLRAADADQASATLRSALLRAADADQASATLRSALLCAADADQASATLRSALLRAADADQASATLRSALLRAADADQVRTRPWALHIASPLAPAAALTNDSPSLARPGCFHAAALPLAKVTTRHAFLYVADAGLASVIHHFAFPLPADADLASITCRLAFLRTCDAVLMHAAPLFAFLRPADAYLEDDLLPHAHTSWCSRGLLHRDGAPLLPASLALPNLGDVVRRLPLLVVHQAATDRRPSWQIPIRPEGMGGHPAGRSYSSGAAWKEQPPRTHIAACLLGLCLPLLRNSTAGGEDTGRPAGRSYNSGAAWKEQPPRTHIAAGLLLRKERPLSRLKRRLLPPPPPQFPSIVPVPPHPTHPIGFCFCHPSPPPHSQQADAIAADATAVGSIRYPGLTSLLGFCCPRLFFSSPLVPHGHPTRHHTQQADATAVGSIRYPGLTSLLGFCCQGEHRLLISDFMPNCTLAQHLFHWEQRPMSWLARLAVAVHVVQALEHLGQEGAAAHVLAGQTGSGRAREQRPMSWLARLAVAMRVVQALEHLGREKGILSDTPPHRISHPACLFSGEQRPMSWLARLAVAMRVAQALEHLGREKGMPVYHDLNPYKVLLDKDNEPKLSCFGLIKPLKDGRYSSNLDYLPPEQLLHGRVTAESVVYSFGLILLALFSGKSIRPTQFLEMVEEKQDLSLLLDSNLLSHAPSVEFALELVPLIAECLKKDPADRPPMDSIAEFLGILDDRSRGIGNSLGLAGEGEEREEAGASAATAAAASPLARAAMEGDWEVLHRRLVTVSFTPPQEPSFEVWNAEIQDLVSSRQRGDKAFKSQQWEEAIALYTKFLKCDSPPIPVLFARRCLSHLQLGHWEEAYQDALQAQQSKPPWPEATYLVAAALIRLGRADEGQEMIAAGPNPTLERTSGRDSHSELNNAASSSLPPRIVAPQETPIAVQRRWPSAQYLFPAIPAPPPPNSSADASTAAASASLFQNWQRNNGADDNEDALPVVTIAGPRLWEVPGRQPEKPAKLSATSAATTSATSAATTAAADTAASGSSGSTRRPSGEELYIVYFRNVPSVIDYKGGIPGFAATAAPATGDGLTASAATAATDDDADDAGESLEAGYDSDATGAPYATNGAAGAGGRSAGASSGGARSTGEAITGLLNASVASIATAGAGGVGGGRRARSRAAASRAAAAAAAVQAMGALDGPRGSRRADERESDVRAFAQFVGGVQQHMLQAVGIPKNRIVHSYRYVLNGVSIKLTRSEAHRLQRHESVLKVERSQTVSVQTIHTPQFLQLPSRVWPSVGGRTKAGNGMIIGIVDTGIWPEHPSFSDKGYPPVPPRWRGKCTTTSDFKGCSKKIIGARYFAEGLVASGGVVDPSTEYLSPRDASDHGTWCAGAAAGNPVKVSGGGVQFGTASGMAPRARIAVYKAIWVQGKLAVGSDSDVFAAVDRAVADGVDVLSMSVAINEETYFKHLAMLRAARAGVFVSLVAGNSGPPPASPKLYRTLTNLSPYYITVAASTSSQAWPPQARLSLGNRQSYLGETLLGGSTATRRLPLVDGKTAAAAGYTASQAEACVPYSLSPSKVRGKIVVCCTGFSYASEKAAEVARVGGRAIIVVPYANGEGAVKAVALGLPGLFPVFWKGKAIREYIRSTPNPTATLSALFLPKQVAPEMAVFSGAGPSVNPAAGFYDSSKVTNAILKPDITAPGVSLLGPMAAGLRRWSRPLLDFQGAAERAESRQAEKQASGEAGAEKRASGEKERRNGRAEKRSVETGERRNRSVETGERRNRSVETGERRNRSVETGAEKRASGETGERRNSDRRNGRAEKRASGETGAEKRVRRLDFQRTAGERRGRRAGQEVSGAADERSSRRAEQQTSGAAGERISRRAEQQASGAAGERGNRQAEQQERLFSVMDASTHETSPVEARAPAAASSAASMAASAVSSLSAGASDSSAASTAAISIEESPHGRTASPCAACKFLRRKCTAECVFAPYFPPDQPGRFANVHRVFGASNVTRILAELPPELRGDAANSMAYEAEARVQDPVYGCVSAISLLQQHVVHLQTELLVAQQELSGLQRELEASAQAAQAQASQAQGQALHLSAAAVPAPAQTPVPTTAANPPPESAMTQEPPAYPPTHTTATNPLSFPTDPSALSAPAVPTAPTAVPSAPFATAPSFAVPAAAAAAAAPSVACASQAAAAAAAAAASAPDASVPPPLLLNSVTGAVEGGAGVPLMHASFESQTPSPAGTAIVTSLQAAPVAALQPAPVSVL
ncbi:unnamed protein product [Closterium sp. NIES-65]|nr:unnamed protein product [Closterium sp. NIES-65]